MNELTRTTLALAARQLDVIRFSIEDIEGDVQELESAAVSVLDCLTALEEAAWHLEVLLLGEDEPSPIAPMRDLSDIPNPNAQIAY